MWNQPWKLAEGFLIGAVLVAAGLLLQFTFGPVNWDVFAFPFNILVLVVFLLLVAVAFFLRAKVYVFRYLGSSLSAIPALCYAVGLTAVMGLTRQVPSAQPATDLIGLTHMLSFWPFVLVYVWIAFILGIVTLKRLTGLLQLWKKSSPRRDIPFLLNHLGLFITMTTATLGNADMQRLKMTISSEGPEWRAVDDEGRMHELPIAIRLEDFRIDEYPPKLVMVDNNTGRPLGGKQAETLLLDSAFTTGQLGNWLVTLHRSLDCATPVAQADSIHYEEWNASGAVSAVRVDVEWHPRELVKRRYTKASGWITCGSYMFPAQMLKIDDHLSVAMLPREPQRYVSQVDILTESGQHIRSDILVNKPSSVDGWKIYQLNYDTAMGRWSEISVLELVRDPWLPFVYTGIIMMLLGAVCMFLARPHRAGDAPLSPAAADEAAGQEKPITPNQMS